MKICSTCKISKKSNEFHKRSDKKDGLNFRCKDCDKIWRSTNRDKLSARKRSYYKSNKDEIQAKQREYNRVNSSVIKLNNKIWRTSNKNKILVHNKNNYKSNKDEIQAKQREYNRANIAKLNAIGAKRRAAKLQRTPKWLTENQLKEIETFYFKAKRLEKETGVEHHVDHIIPLQGKTVSGLHVPWNLRVVTATENLEKGNKLA